MERAGRFSPESAICGCAAAASASSGAHLLLCVGLGELTLPWQQLKGPPSIAPPALPPAADPQTPTGSQHAEQTLSAFN